MQQMICRKAGERQIKPNPHLEGVIFRARLRAVPGGSAKPKAAELYCP
jgi:hypothetical protein